MNTEIPELIQKYFDSTKVSSKGFPTDVYGEYFHICNSNYTRDAGFSRGTNFYSQFSIYPVPAGVRLYHSEEKFIFNGDTGNGLRRIREKDLILKVKIIDESSEKLVFGYVNGLNTITIVEYSNATRTVSMLLTFDMPHPVYVNNEHKEYVLLTNKG